MRHARACRSHARKHIRGRRRWMSASHHVAWPAYRAVMPRPREAISALAAVGIRSGFSRFCISLAGAAVSLRSMRLLAPCMATQAERILIDTYEWRRCKRLSPSRPAPARSSSPINNRKPETGCLFRTDGGFSGRVARRGKDAATAIPV